MIEFEKSKKKSLKAFKMSPIRKGPPHSQNKLPGEEFWYNARKTSIETNINMADTKITTDKNSSNMEIQ